MKFKIKSNVSYIASELNIPKNKNGCAIIFLPGYLDTKDYYSFKYFGKNLSKEGFLTIAFDPTGTWESGGKISNYKFSQYLKDIKLVIKFIKKKYSFTKKIILIGHSWGASVALVYQSLNSGITASLLIEPSKELNLKKWGDLSCRSSTRDLPKNKDKLKEFCVPRTFMLDALKYNVLKIAKKSKTPCHFIAGKKDTVIKPKIVKEIYASTKDKKNTSIKLVTILD